MRDVAVTKFSAIQFSYTTLGECILDISKRARHPTMELILHRVCNGAARQMRCRLKAIHEQLSAAFFKTGAAASSSFFFSIALLYSRYSCPAARDRKMWLFCRYICLCRFVSSLENDGNSDGLRNIIYSCFRFPLYRDKLSWKSRC